MAVKINADNLEEQALRSTGLVLLEFYTDFCVPCKRMSPVLAEIEEKYAGRILVGKVNATVEEELVKKYDVLSTPTFLLIKDGNLVGRTSGILSKESLVQLIDEKI